jgi:hypothetical protein
MTNAIRTETGYVYLAVGGLCWECGTLVEGWPLHSTDEVLHLYRTDPVTKAKVVICSHICKSRVVAVARVCLCVFVCVCVCC